MTLLALLAARQTDSPSNPPVGEVVMPTPPYNAAQYLAIPTPDATNQATHPGIVDMGEPGWNGWRYWMAMTPYAGGNDDLENPCIIVSNDAVTWEEPAGITNPIDPWPGGSGYNSDTDIAYDPDTGRMWVWWREAVNNRTEAIHFTSSLDGVTWAAQATAFETDHLTKALSPAIVRVGPGDWRMWTIGYNGQPSTMRRAPSPSGPWSAPEIIALNGVTEGKPWHVDVVLDQASGLFHMLLNVREPWGYVPLTSPDGLNWTARNGGRRFLTGSTWDQIPYRATFALEPNGQVYGLWYGGTLGDLSQWRIGYTRVPRSLWAG